MSCFVKKQNSFEVALNLTTLNPLEKSIIKERFLYLLQNNSRRCIYISIYFHIIRLFITVGSLIVPALLSIQYTNTTSTPGNITDPGTFPYKIYWTTWVISLLVTTSNGILSTFKVDKKYYILHTTVEQLRSEGWQYLELTGRYSGFYTPGIQPTHQNQFIFFCSTVEKIKMKQVEEEYYKLSDTSHTQLSHATRTGNASSTSEQSTEKKDAGIIPPTPLNNLKEQAAKMPKELLKEISPLSSLREKPGADIEKEEETNEKETKTKDSSMPVSTELRTVTIGEDGHV